MNKENCVLKLVDEIILKILSCKPSKEFNKTLSHRQDGRTKYTDFTSTQYNLLHKMMWDFLH